MPSEFALREMPHLINQEFYMVSCPRTKERWRVLLTPRRNKGKFEHTICSKGWKRVSPVRKKAVAFLQALQHAPCEWHAAARHQPSHTVLLACLAVCPFNICSVWAWLYCGLLLPPEIATA